MPPPVPPIVKLGRKTHGRPTFSTASNASARFRTTNDFGTSTPILIIASLNFCRSSAFSITSARAPIISTLYFSRTPCFHRSIAVLRPVCPPSVGSSASGRSLAMIFSTTCQVIGSM
jgi:hypothetical protein